MAYNLKLADRIREIIADKHHSMEEKKMFAGLCFIVNDKMCIGVHEDKIMVRFDPAKNEEVMKQEGCEPMNFTGRTMKGFVFVSQDVLRTKKQLNHWVQLALDFNKFARSSKKPVAKKKVKAK
jgi:TfoX/Sxy family transcriptional regulator of competence genes